MVTETWKFIPGYEGAYEISNLGRIRSHVFRTEPTVINSYPNKFGYYIVTIRNNEGVKRTRKVHHLVLEAHVGPRPLGYYALHNNDDKSNNTLENLRWGTPKENNADCVKNGKHYKGKRTHCGKGHEFTPENTYYHDKTPTWRYCRTCRSAINSAVNEAKKEAREAGKGTN